MKQKLEIEVDEVQLLRREGPDHLSITIRNPEMVARICGKEIAEKVWYNQIHLEIRITHGKGEKLAEELGLTIDEVIEPSRPKLKFRHE